MTKNILLVVFTELTLPFLIQFEVHSGPRRGPEHEAKWIYGRTVHRDFNAAAVAGSASATARRTPTPTAEDSVPLFAVRFQPRSP